MEGGTGAVLSGAACPECKVAKALAELGIRMKLTGIIHWGGPISAAGCVQEFIEAMGIKLGGK